MARWTLSVMAAALLALLVWSVWREAGWQTDGYPRGIAQAGIGRGQIFVELVQWNAPLPAAAAGSFYRGFWIGQHQAGMDWRPAYGIVRAPGALQRWVWIPIWIPLVLFAGGAGFCWRRHVRRRRRDRIIKAGGCPHCGYDLHGLAAHGETQGEETNARAVCPECGK